jgi:S-adenosylmethionine:tRNA ribosyltransferase-isomerase
MTVIDFALPSTLEAHEPPEARGLDRDGVRLLVGSGDTVAHHRFTDLPGLLRPGDVLVVNTSGTLAAAVPVSGRRLALHFSTALADGRWLVELRRDTGKATQPYRDARAGETYPLPGNASITLVEPFSAGRLWVSTVELPGFDGVESYLNRFGRPIRYGYVPREWPIEFYQTVFAQTPGSDEMPIAARPFSDRRVTRLALAGVRFAPVLLHTGVASPEAHERPYPERFEVSAATARVVNEAQGRVIAVGTTAVRALETAAGPDGVVRPARGWTELVVTPERGVRVVSGLLTGIPEPRASHLDLLAAVAGRDLLDRCYRAAIDGGYLWHEFGDLNLLLPVHGDTLAAGPLGLV